MSQDVSLPPPASRTIPQDLHGSFVRLRRYSGEDAGAVRAAVLESGPGLAFYETWARRDFSLEEAADYVDFWRVSAEAGRAYNFAVEALGTGAFLGSCGLFGIEADHGVAGLGFWTRGAAQGRGVASEAAGLLVGFGFDHLGLNRIELLIAVGNAASHRVAEKLGAIAEGTLRQRLVLGGQPRDAVMYALLRPGSASAE